MRIKLPAITALLLALCAAIHAGNYNTNLIVNGDAEGGAGSLSGNDILSIPGWTVTNGNFTVVQYGASSDVPANSPGPANRGTNFFAGGPTSPLSTATQIVDVSFAAADIDTGLATAELSGWLGGWQDQDDHATFAAAFLNGSAAVLGQFSLATVLAVDRTNNTALLFRSLTNSLPAGTRRIQLTLTMTRATGSYNDGYADNLSLVLRYIPKLAITSAGNNALLSWSTNAIGYQLQTAPALSPSGQWTPTTNTIVISGGSFLTTNTPTTAQRYFRLYKP